MKFDLSIQSDQEKFLEYQLKLISKEAKVELKEIKPPRTLNQNAYLHCIIQLFANEIGYTLEEMKLVLKGNCSFMSYEKDGFTFPRFTSELDKGEMTKFIEYVRDQAGMMGIYLPSSDEYLVNKFEIERRIEEDSFS